MMNGVNFGDYEYFDRGWHRLEIEVSMGRPNTIELVETLADLIQASWLELDDVDEILMEHRVGFSFKFERKSGSVQVNVSFVGEMPATENADIPNILQLVRRMDILLENDDYPGVIHTSASIFETLAKDVIADPSIQNQTLLSFFDRYRTDSRLPDALLDYVLGICRRRNTEPLAGHGQTAAATITKDAAVVLARNDQSFVRVGADSASV